MARSVVLPKELQGYLEHPGGPKCHKKFKLVKVSFCEGKMNTLTGQVPKVSIFISVNGFGQVMQAMRAALGRAGPEGGGPLQLNNLTLPGHPSARSHTKRGKHDGGYLWYLREKTVSIIRSCGTGPSVWSKSILGFI